MLCPITKGNYPSFSIQFAKKPVYCRPKKDKN